MYRERVNHGSGLIVVCVLIFIGVAVWWLESRFSSTVAIMVIGGLFGVLCLIAGYMLNLASTRHTLETAARFNEALATTERHRQMTFREHARSEREAFNARAKLEVVDAKRIDQIAQQRASLLMDLERQRYRQDQARQIPQWAVDDEGDDGQFQTWD